MNYPSDPRRPRDEEDEMRRLRAQDVADLFGLGRQDLAAQGALVSAQETDTVQEAQPQAEMGIYDSLVNLGQQGLSAIGDVQGSLHESVAGQVESMQSQGVLDYLKDQTPPVEKLNSLNQLGQGLADMVGVGPAIGGDSDMAMGVLPSPFGNTSKVAGKFNRAIDNIEPGTIQKTPRMPFGKHKGQSLGDVPEEYVRYMDDSGYLDKGLRTQFEQAGKIQPLNVGQKALRAGKKLIPESNTGKAVLGAGVVKGGLTAIGQSGDVMYDKPVVEGLPTDVSRDPSDIQAQYQKDLESGRDLPREFRQALFEEYPGLKEKSIEDLQGLTPETWGLSPSLRRSSGDKVTMDESQKGTKSAIEVRDQASKIANTINDVNTLNRLDAQLKLDSPIFQSQYGYVNMDVPIVGPLAQTLTSGIDSMKDPVVGQKRKLEMSIFNPQAKILSGAAVTGSEEFRLKQELMLTGGESPEEVKQILQKRLRDVQTRWNALTPLVRDTARTVHVMNQAGAIGMDPDRGLGVRWHPTESNLLLMKIPTKDGAHIEMPISGEAYARALQKLGYDVKYNFSFEQLGPDQGVRVSPEAVEGRTFRGGESFDIRDTQRSD